jgi:hypothetical protein
MKKLYLLLLLSLPAQARVKELSLDLKRMPFQRDYLFPDRTNWGHEVRLNADGEIGRFFMNNQVTGRTYDSRFRYVSWGFDVGFHVFPWLDVVHSHLSEHAIDLYRDKFPVRDSYGIRLKFTE